ncbi:MAG: sulfatase [Acidobacteriota bacterium]
MRWGKPWAFVLLFLGGQVVTAQPMKSDDGRPNFLIIGAEDISPDLRCYGDRQAITPNLDGLAGQGVRFTRAFTHAPVCAPSRSGLITGRYPTSMGTHHMRSKLIAPPPTFTSLLRNAGYRVYWPGKTDFNFDVPADAFDSTDDWRQHPLQEPFLAYINFTGSHESQIRATREEFAKKTARLRPEERHDPSKVIVPPFYPDAPEVRRDIANYYDLVTAVDYQVGDVLRELERRKLADRTLVLFFGDHGRGMPRYKRWVYDTGTRVPLIVRWPGQIAPGSVRDDLVCFLDIAPTFLALAGAPVPEGMQGQVFLGPQAKAREYVFAARDRMDETYDRIRSVRDKRYQYIRNFHPELPYAQEIAYMELMPTMQVWRRLHSEKKLVGPASLFFAARKPQEELYDLEEDPYEINNLAESPAHQDILKRMRAALDRWMVETQDLGGVPERELIKRSLVRDVLAAYEERKGSGKVQ